MEYWATIDHHPDCYGEYVVYLEDRVVTYYRTFHDEPFADTDDVYDLPQNWELL